MMKYLLMQDVVMKTTELLQELMHKSGLTGLALAKALVEEGVTQATISRFLTGKTKEPKRSSLAPVADYFGISVEAFFDEALAEQVLAKVASGEFVVSRRSAGRSASLPAARIDAPKPVGLPSSTSLEACIETIAHSLTLMADAHRETMAGKLAALARAPDSPTLKKSIFESLGSTALPPTDST